MSQNIWIPSPNEIRKLRLRAKLSQRELARRAGVSQSLIARLEKGEVNIRLSTLQKILKVLYEALSDEDIAENYMHKPVITLNVNDTVKKAIEIMDKYGISQIPVLDEKERIVGTVLETSLLKSLMRNGSKFLEKRIGDIMEEPLPQILPSTPINIVEQILTQYPAALVVSQGKIVGIITKIDIIKKFAEKRVA